MVTDALRRSWYRAKDALLGAVRRGPAEVVWTESFMGIGNLLYLALWASGRSQGRLLSTPRLERWLETFPALRGLVVDRADVRFTDRRLSAVSRSYGEYGKDFDRVQLDSFIARYLADAFRADPDESVVVVNVRRGDYYSVPEHRGGFGFDQDAYLRIAIGQALGQGAIREIRVVSDGIDWCRARLGWMSDHCETLVFSEPEETAEQNLRSVAQARRLILTNSTFCYWAGYIHDVLHPGAESFVIAPDFFERTQRAGRPWQLNPQWTVIHEIPGGWDS